MKRNLLRRGVIRVACVLLLLPVLIIGAHTSGGVRIGFFVLGVVLIIVAFAIDTRERSRYRNDSRY